MGETWGQKGRREHRSGKARQRERIKAARRKKVYAVRHPLKAARKRWWFW